VRRLAVILTAGGRGSRMSSSAPKQFIELAGKPVLAHALHALFQWMESLPECSFELVLTHPADAAGETDEILWASLAGFPHLAERLQAHCAVGGDTRQDSVRLGLHALSSSAEAVFIHDGARPFARPDLYHRLLSKLDTDGRAIAVVPLLPATDTLKQLDASGCITATVDRSRVRAVQTPQLLRLPQALELHARAEADGFAATDDASLVERYASGRVLAVEGDPANLKLTTPQDLLLAEALLAQGEKLVRQEDARGLRVGQGFDVHAFCEGRPLVLGGVEIPFERGLAGHSDADVLLHAICDALLGAANLGDIGQHFPDTDPAWKGADSWELLKAVAGLLAGKGWRVVNLDATLICQRPKLAPYREAMRERICLALSTQPGQVSLKATTTERLGFAGREEGIAAQAIVLLESA
jgi:2-C-methyl-D-erythritol 2,4-cyclodiphosphate synthase/2-C-methyl-D-erythritol 4-phosphate cytidylyltransferase